LQPQTRRRPHPAGRRRAERMARGVQAEGSPQSGTETLAPAAPPGRGYRAGHHVTDRVCLLDGLGEGEMKRDKQILRVLRAVEEGCQTSQECAAVAGLPVKHASGYLSALGQDGLIER